METGTLWNVTDLRFAISLSWDRKRNDSAIFLLPENGFEKGAFAGTVRADQSNQLSAMCVKINAFKNLFSTDLDG